MPRQFTGVLLNPTESASRLRVTLVLSADTVDIHSRGASLGRWEYDDVRASRHEGNWFRLNIEDEDWRFLPDSPTEFLFFGVPSIAGSRPAGRRWRFRSRYDAPDLQSIGRIALGAALAALLVSVGMLIGRLQLDDSRVTVLTVLFAGAALGAWWTAASRREPSPLQGVTKKRPLVLPSSQKHSALSVQEVIAASQPDSKEISVDLEAKVPPPETVPSESADPTDDLRPELVDLERSTPVDSIVGVDLSNEQTAAEESESAAPASRKDGEGARRPKPETRSTRDRRTPTKFPDDVTDSRGAGATPEPAIPEEPGSAWAPPDEQASKGEPATDVGPSVSVLGLLELTADVVGEIDLTDRTVGRGADAAPIDLTTVRGIGPALSAGLTRLGVSDVRSLAVLDADDQAYLEERLGRFASRDRIRRWVEHAQRIVAEHDGGGDA